MGQGWGMSTPGSLTLQVLGAGSAFSRHFGTTCSVLTLPNGQRWLIDCGRQAPEQLAHAGLRWHDISGQIITHVHGDHVFGLEEFAFVRYYRAAKGLSAVMKGGPRPYLVAHSAVLSELWEMLGPSLRYRSDASGGPVSGSLSDYFQVLEPAGVEPPRSQPWNHAESFRVGAFSLLMRETRHVHGKPSTSIEFALPGEQARVAWWSGDSVVDAELLGRLASRTSIFFHDCTFAEFPGQVHGLFSDFEKLTPALREKVVLMHHDDGVEQHRERAEALGFRLALPGDVYDLCSGRRIEHA
jgi:ribonuclease BN (tRNA processing enzyme)